MHRCILLVKPFRGHISGFLTGSFFLRGGIVNPTPNPQPGGPGPIFITPGTEWPSYTARHWVPILVTFYDQHGLQWDYSLLPVTTWDNKQIWMLKFWIRLSSVNLIKYMILFTSSPQCESAILKSGWQGGKQQNSLRWVKSKLLMWKWLEGWSRYLHEIKYQVYS